MQLWASQTQPILSSHRYSLQFLWKARGNLMALMHHACVVNL